MVEQENLDVRTITIGISLLECIDSNLDKLNEIFITASQLLQKILPQWARKSSMNLEFRS